MNTAVYRAISKDGSSYFIKLRKGHFKEISVELPQFLKNQRQIAIIAPLRSVSGRLWVRLDPYKMILYPFIEGRNGYEVALSDRQWLDFGAALKGIHAAQLPQALASLIPHERYSPQWREMVRRFQAQAEERMFPDPIAAKCAKLMKAQQVVIDRLVSRTDQFGRALKAHPPELVLCHADLHAGNLLLGVRDTLYIVDWDDPLLAPREKDLALIGGSSIWNDPRGTALFYQGYAAAHVDPIALAYFRYERIIQDIAAYCMQLLSSNEGGKDREQGLKFLTSNFLPGGEIGIAIKNDTDLP